MIQRLKGIKPKNISDKGQRSTDYFKECISKAQEKFDKCPDIIMRKVFLKNDRTGYFFYVRGIVNIDILQRDFINSIIELDNLDLLNEKDVTKLPVAGLSIGSDFNTAIKNILSGYAVFLAEGLDFHIECNMLKFEKRSVDEPETEKNVRGSHEGFIESITTNMATLRRRIKNTNLKFETYELGKTTNQTAAIAYIQGIANPELFKILDEKMRSINYDGLLAIGYIEQLITDHPNALFPQYRTSERPDKCVASLLEGKFVIMLDGTPVTLVVPVNFLSFLQTTDDFSTNWISGTFLRLLRLFGVVIAVFLPALYIAILSFHYYSVPLNLIIPLGESRVKVPFPPVIEALIMEITIEMLREAAIRLPTYIGTSIGVVGGLIIGQAAVEAGIVSNLMIIVVSVTAIASFIIPNYDMGLSVRIIRFAVMINAAVFGIIGIVVSFATFLAHLLSLESLGQPYFQPIMPFKYKDLKDAIFRLPLQLHYKRPDIAQPKDKKRGSNNG